MRKMRLFVISLIFLCGVFLVACEKKSPPTTPPTKSEQAALVITNPGSKNALDQDFQLATTGGSTGKEVVFERIYGNAASVSKNGLVSINRFGSIIVRATMPGDDNYNDATSAELTIAISGVEQSELTITDPGTKTFGDSPFQLATTGGSGTGVVTYSRVYGTVATVNPTGEVTITGAGSITVRATKPADDIHHSITSEDLVITISPQQLAAPANLRLVGRGLEWDAVPSATNYTLFLNGGIAAGGDETIVHGTWLDVIGLIVVGRDDTIGVRANGNVNYFSSEVVELTARRLPAPINLRIGDIEIPGTGNVSGLLWDAVPGATSYVVRLWQPATSTTIVNNENVGNVLQFVIPVHLLENNAAYIITVTAIGNGSTLADSGMAQRSFTHGVHT
jgi:hypothetical protein